MKDKIKNKFKELPDDRMLNKICTEALPFKSYSDKKTVVPMNTLLFLNTTAKFKAMIDDINRYLVNPVKIEKFNNCISITKLFLKTRELDIIPITKLIKGVKVKHYKIVIVDMIKIMRNRNNPTVISFDQLDS